ncbi:MAG TPA: thiamine pyrophosphate-binding protein [Geminicoccus sp.]|jgi:acetolactate synthase-1/2/3 large subunit|uniref:thiamine pyrophosphate-binding protein n=1 Tax=Geminicoccus sp. TaxID=2024832 RepID=UPI002E31AD07|nr:thiamine pyrophosphate-binding protein [Geminicoccus sp.]HEX2525252.1 thiamine pyrophosphate-binding protein [Geminicoccus sp.]
MSTRSGGRILIDQLAIQGVDTIFGVPGESYLEALDALVDSPIRFVTCRQEGGAAMAAEAYGKLTGRAGVCFVTRAPGATNASSGVHVAQQDSTPLILLVGQIERSARYRDAFQEVDYQQLFGGMAKLVLEIDDAARLPEHVHRAFRTAMSGRPGPVVLVLPEDMLTDKVEASDGIRVEPVAHHPDPAALDRLNELLAKAERPLVILGGSGWTPDGRAALESWIDGNDLPAACSFRRQSLFDNLHRCWAGAVGLGPDPKLAERVKAADLLIAFGSRLSETATAGYTLLGLPRMAATFVQIHPDPAELGRVYQPDLAICADLSATAQALAAREPILSRPWTSEAETLHARYLAFSEPVEAPGELNMSRVVQHLQHRLPEDTIITNGAGNFAIWVQRFWRYRTAGSQLSPTSGSMGYGLPAAVAAAIAAPSRTVVAFAGDGDFMMTCQELSTAVQAQARLLVLVVDNGMYGTIRMHQEREHPGRESATALKNPDFAAMARAMGAHGATVRTTDAFAAALDEALAQGGPALLHLIQDPEAITPVRTLTKIREEARAAGR